VRGGLHEVPSVELEGDWVAEYGTVNKCAGSVPGNTRMYTLSKAVPLHATEALRGRGGIAPTHS
jgi:hypothetical protein